ncbi:MAG TPA: hypothetical protein PK012_13560, partial [Blastocatellia bacterium]|nr:hypothetical protein [Blastocatellia bacterium]
MNPMTRRQFAQSLGAAVAAPAILNSAIWAGQKNKRLPIAFSTLGCPKWDWKTILDQAAQHGYSALELRGVGGEMDLPKSPQFIGAKLKESLKDLEAEVFIVGRLLFHSGIPLNLLGGVCRESFGRQPLGEHLAQLKKSSLKKLIRVVPAHFENKGDLGDGQLFPKTKLD